MKWLRLILAILALAFGLLGVVACLAAIYGTWHVANRLDNANTRVFDGIDRSLTRAREGVGRAEQRVRESRITSEELGQRLSDWAKLEAAKQLVERWELEVRTGQLALRLQQVDAGFQVTAEAIEFAQLLREMSDRSDEPDGPDRLQQLQEQLAVLRGALQQANGLVEEVRELSGQLTRGETPEQRAVRIATWGARILATIVTIDQHLRTLSDRLSDLQTRAQHVKTKTSHRILSAAIALTFVLVWLGAGQAALARLGGKMLRGPRRSG